MKKIFLYFSVLFFIAACGHSNQQHKVAETNTGDSSQLEFFPVTSFLKGQLRMLDSIQVTPLQITTVKSKTDSSWIKAAELTPLLQDFITAEITTINLLPFFTEAKFNDQSTDAITFTYNPKTTLPDSISIRHWDVYIAPQTGQVKRVYIVKRLSQNGKLYTQQLTWQTDKSARITTILDEAGGKGEIIKDMKLVWRF